MSIYCFNCELMTDHISKHCDQPQKYTNCPHCGNVCLPKYDSHRPWCQIKDFRSTIREPFQFVQQSTEALELWCSEELTHILDGDVLKVLSAEPVLISTENVFLVKNGLTIKLYKFGTKGNVRVSIGDSSGNDRLRILVDDKKFVLNNKIRVEQDGTITIRNIESDVQRSNLHLICVYKSQFKIRVVNFNGLKTFGFVVGRNNVEIDNDVNNGRFASLLPL